MDWTHQVLFGNSRQISGSSREFFYCPTHLHPSMEAPNPLFAPPLIPVGQAAVPMVLAIVGIPGVPAQPAGMTVETFDTLLALYFTMQSKVYGVLMRAIENFTALYDHVMDNAEIIAMQEGRLLGSRVFVIIRDYCTNNVSDTKVAVTIAEILNLRLHQFDSCATLIRAFNERYHVLPPRHANSDAQKKLQLRIACGKVHKNFIVITGENKTYHELCTSLVEMEESETAADALDGLKSERGVLKVKSHDETTSEVAMASVEENTASNRSTVGVRFHSSPAAYRRGSSSYRSRSYSNDRNYRKHDRSPSPGHYQSNRRRDYSRSNSRSPSPYTPRDRSPGRSHHVVRYENVNSQWRTGGSGYRDSRTEGVKCFNCGVMGHKSNTCPRNQAAAAAPGPGSGGVKCYSCGRLGHKAHECSDRRNR